MGAAWSAGSGGVESSLVTLQSASSSVRDQEWAASWLRGWLVGRGGLPDSLTPLDLARLLSTILFEKGRERSSRTRVGLAGALAAILPRLAELAQLRLEANSSALSHPGDPLAVVAVATLAVVLHLGHSPDGAVVIGEALPPLVAVLERRIGGSVGTALSQGCYNLMDIQDIVVEMLHAALVLDFVPVADMEAGGALAALVAFAGRFTAGPLQCPLHGRLGTALQALEVAALRGNPTVLVDAGLARVLAALLAERPASVTQLTEREVVQCLQVLGWLVWGGAAEVGRILEEPTLVPSLSQLLVGGNRLVVLEATWVLFHVAFRGQTEQRVLLAGEGVLGRLVVGLGQQLADRHCPIFILATLKTFLVPSEDVGCARLCRALMVDAGLLGLLAQLRTHPISSVRMSAAALLDAHFKPAQLAPLIPTLPPHLNVA